MALAEKCNLELTDEQVEKLQIITQFNISARYDDYKETRIQLHPITTEDFEKISNPFVKEVVDTGIKVA